MVLWIAPPACDSDCLLESTDGRRPGGIGGAGFRPQCTRDAMWALLPFIDSLQVPEKLLEAKRIRNRTGIRNLCEHRTDPGEYCDALRRRAGCDRKSGEKCRLQRRYSALDCLPAASKRIDPGNGCRTSTQRVE